MQTVVVGDVYGSRTRCGLNGQFIQLRYTSASGLFLSRIPRHCQGYNLFGLGTRQRFITKSRESLPRVGPDACRPEVTSFFGRLKMQVTFGRHENNGTLLLYHPLYLHLNSSHQHAFPQSLVYTEQSTARPEAPDHRQCHNMYPNGRG